MRVKKNKKVFPITIRISEVINRFNLIGITKIIIVEINKKLANERILQIPMKTIIIINTGILEATSKSLKTVTPGLLKIVT